MPKSFKPEVVIDSSGKWCGNALRFATRQEAEDNASDLGDRWMAVREFRASESDDEPNYSYVDRNLVALTRSSSKIN